MSFFSYLRSAVYYTVSVAPIVLAIDHGVASVAYVQGKSMTPSLNGKDPINRWDLGCMRALSKINGSFSETNDIVLIRKLLYEPKRGDVVVLDSPGKPGQQVVKRLIAMEGDIIMYYASGRRKSFSTIQSEVETAEKIAELSNAMPEHNDMQELLEELTQHFKAKQNEEGHLNENNILNIDSSTKDFTDNNNNNSQIADTPTVSQPTINIIKYTDSPIENRNFKFEDVELRLIKIPMGHCWVEGDNPYYSRDSRDYGPVPLGMVRGGVAGIIWPPNLAGFVRSHQGSTNIIHTHSNHNTNYYNE